MGAEVEVVGRAERDRPGRESPVGGQGIYDVVQDCCCLCCDEESKAWLVMDYSGALVGGVISEVI